MYKVHASYIYIYILYIFWWKCQWVWGVVRISIFPVPRPFVLHNIETTLHCSDNTNTLWSAHACPNLFHVSASFMLVPKLTLYSSQFLLLFMFLIFIFIYCMARLQNEAISNTHRGVGWGQYSEQLDMEINGLFKYYTRHLTHGTLKTGYLNSFHNICTLYSMILWILNGLL